MGQLQRPYPNFLIMEKFNRLFKHDLQLCFSMKVAVGSLQIECTCDEFKEIYPSISNGHEALESIEVTPLKTMPSMKPEHAMRTNEPAYRKGSEAERVLEVMQKQPNKNWDAFALTLKTCTPKTDVYTVRITFIYT